MSALRFVSVCILAGALGPYAAAQSAPSGGAPSGSRELSEARLLAGLREYPGVVRRALLRVAAEPQLVEQLANDPTWADDPDSIQPQPSPELRDAIGVLARYPAAVAILADHPELMPRLARENPARLDDAAEQFRAGYAAARLDAASAWERMLDENPAALNEYRELLTRYCEEAQKRQPDFPFVVVTETRYYRACPPSGEVMAFSQNSQPSSTLGGVLDRWWRENSPRVVDERVLRYTRSNATLQTFDAALAAAPLEQRAAMWRAGPDRPDGAGLVPVVLQPLADQPQEARDAYAVAEQARLWGPPTRAIAQSEPQAPALPPAAPAPQEPVVADGGVAPGDGKVTVRYHDYESESIEYGAAGGPFRDPVEEVVIYNPTYVIENDYDYGWPGYGYGYPYWGVSFGFNYSRGYCGPIYGPSRFWNYYNCAPVRRCAPYLNCYSACRPVATPYYGSGVYVSGRYGVAARPLPAYSGLYGGVVSGSGARPLGYYGNAVNPARGYASRSSDGRGVARPGRSSVETPKTRLGSDGGINRGSRGGGSAGAPSIGGGGIRSAPGGGNNSAGSGSDFVRRNTAVAPRIAPRSGGGQGAAGLGSNPGTRITPRSGSSGGAGGRVNPMAAPQSSGASTPRALLPWTQSLGGGRQSVTPSVNRPSVTPRSAVPSGGAVRSAPGRTGGSVRSPAGGTAIPKQSLGATGGRTMAGTRALSSSGGARGGGSAMRGGGGAVRGGGAARGGGGRGR
jgi:hypothetical protein